MESRTGIKITSTLIRDCTIIHFDSMLPTILAGGVLHGMMKCFAQKTHCPFRVLTSIRPEIIYD